MKKNILGINIDYLTIDRALDTVDKWLQKRGKHYVVTPNPEMIVDALRDKQFKIALNQASLALADSSRLGWASKLINSKHRMNRLIYSPFLLLPQVFSGKEYPTTAGTDLMERLIKVSEEKTYTTAFLGGSEKVADKLFNCLRVKYPKLNIVFCSGNIAVNKNGEIDFDINKYKMSESKEIKANQPDRIEFNVHSLSQRVDILFLAYGHKKQEKWMNKYLPKLNARVMIGVGGAFDYLSGSVPRAPKILRDLGMEWIFRLMVQPWRIKRFWKLPYFVYKVMTVK